MENTSNQWWLKRNCRLDLATNGTLGSKEFRKLEKLKPKIPVPGIKTTFFNYAIRQILGKQNYHIWYSRNIMFNLKCSYNKMSRQTISTEIAKVLSKPSLRIEEHIRTWKYSFKGPLFISFERPMEHRL